MKYPLLLVSLLSVACHADERVPRVSAPCACSPCGARDNNNNHCATMCDCMRQYGVCYCANCGMKNHKDADVINAAISYGDFIDRITILEIKTQRITDPMKLKNIYNELNALRQLFMELVQKFPENEQKLMTLKNALYVINEEMWDIEDAIRAKEATKSFDEDFIYLARSVYRTNDARCAVKREINLLFNSPFIEEKSYKQY